MDKQKEIREHLAELLAGKSAHIDIESALKDFPPGQINERPANSPHTTWELAEHIRIAQSDILEFIRDKDHVSPKFPDGYWTKKSGAVTDWENAVERILLDLQALRDLVADENNDLTAPIPHGDGQTIFREVLLAADHTAYHLGQIMLLRKMLAG